MNRNKDTLKDLFNRLTLQEQNNVINFAYLYDDVRSLRHQLQQKENIIKEVREKIKENQEYLENAKEMYINQNNEILKTHTLQLINNSLVQNDKLLKILDKGE